MKALIPVSALALASLLATPVFAGKERHPGAEHRRGNFVTEIRTTTDDGKVSQRRIEQTVRDGRLERRTVVTAPDGKTATQTVTATRDDKTGEVRRKVEGSDFDGKTYVRESTHRRAGEGRPGQWREHAARKGHADRDTL